ncbi:MAG: hypothetical protein ACRCWS_02445, partial [Propionibacteriaceae bacterium]
MSYNPNQPTDNTPFGQPTSQYGSAAPQQPYGSAAPTGQPAPQHSGTSNPFGAPQQPMAPNYGTATPGFPGAPALTTPKKTGGSLKTAMYPAIVAAVAGLLWIILYFAMYKKNFNAGDVSATKSAITMLTLAEIVFYLSLIAAAVLAALPMLTKSKSTTVQPQINAGYGQQAPYGQQPYGQAPQQPYGQQPPTPPYGQPVPYGMPTQQPAQTQYPTAVPTPNYAPTAVNTTSQYGEAAPATASPAAAQPSSQYGETTSASTPRVDETSATTAHYDTSALADAVEESSSVL